MKSKWVNSPVCNVFLFCLHRRCFVLILFLLFMGVEIKPLWGKTSPQNLFRRGKSQLMSGRTVQATQSFYALSRNKEARKYHLVARYYLARAFFQLGIYDVASLYAGQILEYKTRYRSAALKILLKSFEKTYNDTAVYRLAQAMKKGYFKLNKRQSSDVYFFLGHRLLYLQKLDEAEKFLRRVHQGSSYFYHALYDRALFYVEKGDLSKAKKLFSQLLSLKQESEVTDTMRVTALMSLGRIHYQTKEWQKALSYYSQVPRDSPFWHDSLFESTWVLVQSSRLRSALSNLHSLQSDYYENFYLPESFWLRSLVYLYICRYEEMEKVLQTYNKTYNALLARVRQIVSSSILPSAFYNDILLVRDIKREGEDSSNKLKNLRIPYVLMKHLLNESEIQGALKHLDAVSEQKGRWGRLPSSWKVSAVGRSSWNILQRSMNRGGKGLAFWIRRHLNQRIRELESLDVQMNLVRYEMIKQKKAKFRESLVVSDKKDDKQIDSEISYGAFLQNGYDYWPFQGEYWQDEVGNYYYLGKSQCDKAK